MNKYFFLAALLCAGAIFTSCKKDDEENEEQQPARPEVTTAVLDFEGEAWSQYIPSGQSFGTNLIYGDEAKDYSWSDAATGLSSKLTMKWGGANGFAEGGVVVSNFIDADIEHHATSDYQLSVPASNGSQNFAIVYCEATIKFPEGVRRVIQSIDISPTTYELGVVKYGNDYAQSLADSGELKLVVTADDGTSFTINMARNGKILDTWRTFYIRHLIEGPVNSLTFTMTGSDSSEYGGETYLNTPAYFAFDNVVVEL